MKRKIFILGILLPFLLFIQDGAIATEEETFTGYLDSSNTYEIHSITLPNDGELRFKIVYDSTLYLSYYYGVQIYDVNGTMIFYKSVPSSGIIYGPYGIKAGTYYIKINRDTGYGGYTLTTMYDAQTIANDTEPNDTYSDANAAPNNGSVTGHLGYKGGGDGTTDTVDLYKILLNNDGELRFKIIYDSTLDISGYNKGIRIYDIYETLLFYESYPSSGITYGPYGLGFGTYYIKILRDTGYGGYTFTITSSGQKEDFLGTWSSQGVYYRNSDTGSWEKIATPATKITAGDIDNDGTDDLLGIWPFQGGVWVKYSSSGSWARLSSTADWIGAGDMNGDGRCDLLGTWNGQGVYYRNSDTGSWVKMATPATQITAGDIDGDGTDDLLGIWPSQGGVWIKYSSSGSWARLSSTADWIDAGDMNGDGWDDLVGTWSGQGVFYKDSQSGSWVLMASSATQITAGDIDGDGTDDLLGIWPAQGGVWVKYSSSGGWVRLSSTADWIAAGRMKGAGGGGIEMFQDLQAPIGGYAEGPGEVAEFEDLSSEGPGGRNFAFQEEKNLMPQEKASRKMMRAPGPGEPGFKYIEQENLVPQEEVMRKRGKKKKQ